MIKVLYEFYYWKPMREVYPHARWYQVIRYRLEKYLRKAFIIIGIIGFLAGFGAGMYELGIAVTKSEITYAYVEREVEVPTREVPPVMKRIAKCESGGKQFLSNGKPVTQLNEGHSTDWGKWQINDLYWDKESKRLGLDYKNSERDNELMAMYIFETRGTVDWKASQSCWNK